jgi:predicted RNA methylase
VEMPHPAIITSGPQLAKVIEEMESGAYPLPEDAVWRDDLPRDLAVRLALATGASMEQIEAGPSEYADDDTPPDPQPELEPEPEQQVAEDEADAIIRHTHEDGTLVYGTSKGDGTAAILKANRFRWFPSIKLWGVAQSRDHLAKRWQINAAADALREAGFKVRVEIDDTPRDVAEVKADRADRLDARYDRLATKAQRNAAEAEARRAAADRISERFADGQPILVGHHSERGARADQKRIEGHDRAANAAYRKAEWASQAARVVGREDARRERPDVVIRRIDKTEAELRQTQHYIDGTRPANDWRGAYGYNREPASGDWLEQLQARKTFLEHQLAADRVLLAEHEANGYVRLSRETVHKGDIVFWSIIRQSSATVTRVNPKTVSLDRRSYPRTLPYEEIQKVDCPHQDTTTTIRMPRRPAAQRETPAVAVERPAERPAPIMVDARFEFFPTPAPVVEQMIAAAGLQPGMTVLEPSAGTGAIAGPVQALGCHVDCVELSQDLARILDAGCYRQVIRADFLEYGPRDNPAGAEYYDRVMMNPPFARRADLAHVTHALRFVKPGGVLVAIMANGVTFHSYRETVAFRELVAASGGAITPLPDDAFKQSGASVRTVLVTIPVPAAQPVPAPSPVPVGPTRQPSLFDEEPAA